jgi:hypothetical protein
MSKEVEWSFSHYSSALSCMQKYLHIVNKTPEDYQSGDMAFGTALHSGINAALTGGDGESVFNIYWNSFEKKELMYGRHKWKDLKDIGLSFMSKFTRLHASKYKLEQAEVRLFGEYEGVRLAGTLDFFGQYNGRTSLRDFKTAGSNYAKEKEHVALQLYLYAYLAKQNNLPYPETLGYTVFNKALGSIQDLTWEFSEAKMHDALNNMVSYIKGLRQIPGCPKNYNACLDYNRKCQYWSKCHG